MGDPIRANLRDHGRRGFRRRRRTYVSGVAVFQGSFDTAHAERLLASKACRALTAEMRARATLYSSAEPCAMCAGAMYWAGIGRLVYGLSEHRLRAVTGNHPENPTLDLPCRTVFASGQRSTEVVGPLLEDEAEALHDGVWKK